MKNNLIKRIISSIILIPLSLFFIAKGSFYLILFICFFFLAASYEWHKMTKGNLYNIFGHFFLVFSFYSFYKIRYNYDENLFYILFIIIICILTDIGGYLFGNLFNGPKLTKLSPKKTYSGLLGSYFLPIVFLLILDTKFSLHLQLDNFKYNLFILVILVSTISQIGDLSISYFKRISKIKDTGKIIPGHGGVLDRIDGMIFVFPLLYLIL